MEDTPLLTIALPIKDGEARLREMLEGVDVFVRSAPGPCEVIAVNDGSSDATAAILAEQAAARQYLQVLTHPVNRGKGAALKTATAAASGRFLLTVDADAAYRLDPESVGRYLAALEAGYDAAIGNRRDVETRFELHPTAIAYIGRRHAMGWLFVQIVRFVLGLRVSDTQCGFKCYRTEVAKRIFAEVGSDRFEFDIEVLALLQLRGHHIAELPVSFVYRDAPSTTRLLRDGIHMLRRLIALRFELGRKRRSGDFEDHTRGDYQDLARRAGHPVQRFWHAHKWPLVEHALAPAAGQRLLDIGTGSSNVAAEAAERCGLVCGADASLAPLHFLHRQPAAKRMVLVGADVVALPFRDASFDRVCVLEVVEHLEAEPARIFAELRRVLAPGGRLLVTTPNYRSLWPVLEWLLDRRGGAAVMQTEQHVRRYHPGSLRAALEASGLRVLELGSVYHLSPFLGPLHAGLGERLFRAELAAGGGLGPVLYAVAEARAA